MVSFIEIIVILIITFFQLKTFWKIKKDLSLFREIFPASAENEWKIEKSSENGVRIIPITNTRHNSIRRKIIDAIGNFLDKNKYNVTDFSLIKDIVDRNSEAEEEAIQTQIPIPLYLGLIGTMLGILLGVVSLVIGRGVTDLASQKGAESIEGLLGGVAIAMFSSVMGNFLTIRASTKAREIKKAVEERKNDFFSWLQAELLPKISSDLSTALTKLGYDLYDFNNSFKQNADTLNNTIAMVSKSTYNQALLLKKLDELNITKIATANIDVYEKLKNCSSEIGTISQNMNEFTENMKNVKENIFGVGAYMEKNIDEYKNRQEFIRNATGSIDIALQKNLGELKSVVDKTSSQYSNLFGEFDIAIQKTSKEVVESMKKNMNESSEQIADNYEKAIDSLHQEITKKLTDFTTLESELKNLTDVKKNIADLADITKKQNETVADANKTNNETLTIMIQEIKQLAETNKTGNATENNTLKQLILEVQKLSEINKAGNLTGGETLAKLILEVKKLADSNKEQNNEAVKNLIQAINVLEQNNKTGNAQLIKDIRGLAQSIQNEVRSAASTTPSNNVSAARSDSGLSLSAVKEIQNLVREIQREHQMNNSNTGKIASAVAITGIFFMILRILSIFGLV